MNPSEKAKIIAYVDCALFILGMFLMGIFSVIFAFQYNPQEEGASQMKLLFIGLIVRFIIAGIFQLVMIVLLLEGVLMKNQKRVFIWLITNRIFLSLMAVSALIKLFVDPISVFAELLAGLFGACALVVLGAPSPLVTRIVEESDFESVSERDRVETNLQMAGFIMLLFFLFFIMLIIILDAGICHKSETKLWIWWIANCVLIGLILFETLLVGGYRGFGMLFPKLPNILFIIYRIYGLVLIRKLIQVLKAKRLATEMIVKSIQINARDELNQKQ